MRDADASTPGDQPYILEFSAGNAGPDSETMDSPASAKNVIATGASENVPGTLAETYGLYADGPDTMADFSSRGPCEDGRIKPDLVAPGTWIASAASAAAPDEAAIAWTAIDDYYVYMGGTSMSGPHAAGAAAVFVQYYKSLHTNAVPSPALVKAALINSADELDEANGGPGPVPNNDEGWGRINLANIIVTNFNTAPRYYQYLDQTVLLTNSQVYSQHIFVQRFGSAVEDHAGLHGRAGISGRDAGAGERSGSGGRRAGRDALSRQPVWRGRIGAERADAGQTQQRRGSLSVTTSAGRLSGAGARQQNCGRMRFPTRPRLTRISRWSRPAISRGRARDSFCSTGQVTPRRA